MNRKYDFVIGDIVRVSIWGQHYDTYKKMFNLLSFNNPQENKDFPKHYENKEIFIIFAIGEHETHGEKIYAIQRLKEGKKTDEQFLFNSLGLTLYKKYKRIMETL